MPVLKAKLKGSLADDFRWVNILAIDLHTAWRLIPEAQFVLSPSAGSRLTATPFPIMVNTSDDDNHHD
ncbi:MAG: hypothetical protein P8Z33_15255 [Gammaproteobacteria bacterium]